MSEEQTIPTTPETPSTENSNVGSEPKADNIIDKADSVAKRLEEANKKSEELLKRHEAVVARMMLGGRAEAGTPSKTKEQIEQEKVEEEAKATLSRYSNRR